MGKCLVHPDLIDSDECALCRKVGQVMEAVRQRVPKDENSPGCFLCKWILLDLEMHGRLTGWNLDSFKKPIFPREGEIAHLKLEGIEFLEMAL